MIYSGTELKFVILPGTNFNIITRVGIFSLSDLGLGSPEKPLHKAPIALPTRPRALCGGAYPEVLNSAVISAAAAEFNPEQEVLVDCFMRDMVSADDEKILRFFSREVAWAALNSGDMFDRKKAAWKTVIDTLHIDEMLRKTIANRIFNRDDLTLENQRTLCGKRVSVPTICEYIKTLKIQTSTVLARDSV